jgi:hypothetical protein
MFGSPSSTRRSVASTSTAASTTSSENSSSTGATQPQHRLDSSTSSSTSSSLRGVRSTPSSAMIATNGNIRPKKGSFSLRQWLFALSPLTGVIFILYRMRPSSTLLAGSYWNPGVVGISLGEAVVESPRQPTNALILGPEPTFVDSITANKQMSTIKQISILGERNSGTRWTYEYVSCCLCRVSPRSEAIASPLSIGPSWLYDSLSLDSPLFAFVFFHKVTLMSASVTRSRW